MPRRRQDDPDQMTLLLPLSRVERTGFDSQGNPTLRIVHGNMPTGEVSPGTFARAVGVNVVTIYGWISRGVIPQDKWRRAGPKLLFIQASEISRLLDTGDK
jgi:hypothetical protein